MNVEPTDYLAELGRLAASDETTLVRAKEFLRRQAEEVARLRALLADLEWAGDHDYSLWEDGLIASCPDCQAYQKSGHAPDCRLKAALESNR